MPKPEIVFDGSAVWLRGLRGRSEETLSEVYLRALSDARDAIDVVAAIVRDQPPERWRDALVAAGVALRIRDCQAHISFSAEFEGESHP